MKERTCIVCGKIFMPRSGTHTHCADCSRPERHHTAPRTYVCKACGSEFTTVYGHEQKYCSRECFRISRRKKERKENPRSPRSLKVCEWCGREFESLNSSQKYCSKECSYEGGKRRQRERWKQAYKPKIIICKECGTEFLTECGDTHSVFCCQSCADKYSRRLEHKSKRHKKYMKEKKRQRKQQISDGFVEEVSYEDVYRRDFGICKICGLPVIKDKRRDPNWSGSIDHIVPVSKGGKHSISNCQLAHRVCNSIKCQEADPFRIDWGVKAKQNNYWRKKFERYRELMLEQTAKGP